MNTSATLVPFSTEECISIKEAAAIAGKTERTIRNWCVQHGIGRRVAGGAWAVSQVALAMLLEGDVDALAAYHGGARAQYEPVARYYRRVGLGDLLNRPEFGGGQEEPRHLPQSPQNPRPCVSALDADPQDDCPPENRAPEAERSGLVEPDEVNPDMILSLVADDPEVKQAGARWDRATPSTHYDLVRARDAAQARMGIPVKNRAFLYSSEIDEYLLPIVVRMWPGDEAATAQVLKRDFNERYNDLSPRVLEFCLRTFHHRNIDGLKRAAGVA
jgi:hypothetical protein